MTALGTWLLLNRSVMLNHTLLPNQNALLSAAAVGLERLRFAAVGLKGVGARLQGGGPRLQGGGLRLQGGGLRLQGGGLRNAIPWESTLSLR